MKVVYILGFARSGSTILSNLLGELDDFVHIGELDRLWLRLTRPKAKCGCGEGLIHCSLWSGVLLSIRSEFESEVMAVANTDYNGWMSSMRALRDKAKDALHTTDASGPVDTAVELYGRVIESVLREVTSRIGARVIIDSSKVLDAALLMRTIGGVDPYYIHLVRDSRGAVLSRQRKRARKIDGRFDLRLQTTLMDSLRWLRRNHSAHTVQRTGDKYLRLSYEELVMDPHRCLDRMLKFLDEDMGDRNPWIDASSVLLRENHTIGGNPNRFKRGSVDLVIDDDWVRSLKRRDFLLITMLTGSLLRKYGYPLRRSRYSSESGLRELMRQDDG